MKHKSSHLIMVMGLPGSGKTYFAKALAEHLGALHLNSDRIRKQLEAQPTYSAEDKSKVYEMMFKEVTDNLIKGERVIVDATFSKASYRSPYLDWAKEHEVLTHIIYVEASESIIAKRVSKKRVDSDADFAVYQMIKAEYEPIVQEHLVLQSDDGPVDQRIAQAMEYMDLNSDNP